MPENEPVNTPSPDPAQATADPSPPGPGNAPPPSDPEQPLKRRAAAAEARAAELQTQLQEARHTLEESREALDASRRRGQIERQLTAQGAIDIETATLLTETSIAGMNEPDLPAAIAELKRAKPFLFRSPPAQRASAMSGEVVQPPALDDAALEARRTGDRRALLRYLRLRRGG